MAKKYNLIFADDMQIWHVKMKEIAQFYPSIRVIQVSTAEEALQLIKNKKVDILITDDNFIMAGGHVSGCELTEDVRDMEKRRKCNHIYIALYSDALSREEAIESGADLIVKKGDNLLRYAIKKALENIR